MNNNNTIFDKIFTESPEDTATRLTSEYEDDCSNLIKNIQAVISTTEDDNLRERLKRLETSILFIHTKPTRQSMMQMRALLSEHQTTFLALIYSAPEKRESLIDRIRASFGGGRNEHP